MASGHPLATEAGVQALRQGGNAIDAAVAVGLTLGVVDARNSGIGGGCFILIRLADGEFVAIDGRETAPAHANRDMFIRNGVADPKLSQTGALASGVPGALAAYAYAVEHYGLRPLKELILPAADLANRGFHISKSYAATLKKEATNLLQFAASKEILFKNGRPLAKGELLRQPDLAATYYSIAEQGPRWFYSGPFAQVADKWMREHGGLLTTDDFRNFRVTLREPVKSTYRGFEIVGFPPPSSGGVHVAEILNILEQFDLGTNPVTRLHVMAEAMKLAFADRAYWLGDPAFTRVPLGLTQKRYAAELSAKIDPAHATPVSGQGTPPGWDREIFRQHTTHFSVADARGNWVACTATLNTSFGSKVVVPGTGVLLNNQMDDFSIQPGVTNFFGLVGADANEVAPGKRPLSSMSPTIVLKNGEPILALGGAGGPRIISQVVNELVCLLDLGMTPSQAIAAPRIHHQWQPDELLTEKELPQPFKAALELLGHKVKPASDMGISHIVARTPGGLGLTGAADPRGQGNVAGW